MYTTPTPPNHHPPPPHPQIRYGNNPQIGKRLPVIQVTPSHQRNPPSVFILTPVPTMIANNTNLITPHLTPTGRFSKLLFLDKIIFLEPINPPNSICLNSALGLALWHIYSQLNFHPDRSGGDFPSRRLKTAVMDSVCKPKTGVMDSLCKPKTTVGGRVGRGRKRGFVRLFWAWQT